MDIPIVKKAQTLMFSPENINGTPGGGSRGTAMEKINPNISVQPGETITLLDSEGPGIIQSMWFGGYTGWNFILRIYWDNMEQPSVECPLCSFFGFGYNLYCDDNGNFPTLNSATVLVAPCRGMNCCWQMPFRRHCRITLENRGDEGETTYYQVMMCKTELSDDAAYFHAAYRQAIPVEDGTEFTIIDGIRGRGWLAGVSMAVGSNSNSGWVEGETKIFIDGEKYPTVNYTGTEDYFGGSYAWGCDNGNFRYEPFSGLYQGMFYYGHNGQEKKARYNPQPRFMMYHWHIPDPVYFSTALRATIQDLPKGGDDFSSVAYWYQSTPSGLAVPLPSPEEIARF